MALKDRISDLIKDGEKMLTTIDEVKIEESAEKIRVKAVKQVESILKNGGINQIKSKGFFRKKKVISGSTDFIVVQNNYNGYTPHWSSGGSEGVETWTLHTNEEAQIFINKIISKLEEEGFKCKITQGHYPYYNFDYKKIIYSIDIESH